MNMNTGKGTKSYTPLTLKLFDLWVLNIYNDLAWRCPTKKYLFPHFLQHLRLASKLAGMLEQCLLSH